MATVKIGDSGGREVSVTENKSLKVAVVDGAGDQITSFGGGTQYTEDAAAAVNPVGNATILVRADTPGALVTSDGDNVAQRGTNYGAAYSQIVTSTGAFVDTFGGGTQYTEDAASVADPVGNQLIARRRDTLGAETTTDGDNVAVNSTNKGELYVKHVDAIPVTDNGSSLTVDATDLDIRDLTFAADKVDASGTVLGAGTNNIGDVDVLTMPAITGTVTANAGTDLNTSALALETTASAIKTAVEIIDNAIAGSEMQVDIVAALPAGNNNIGDVDVASIAAGTNLIGKVSIDQVTANANEVVTKTGSTTVVSSITAALPAGTNTLGSVKITDGTDTANVTAAGELNVIASAQPGTDIGDVTINNASGGSAVNVQDGGNSLTVDNGGTFVTQENGAALTALQLIDDTVFTDDTSTHSTGSTKGIGVMAVANPTDSAIDANDIGMLAMTLARALKTDLTTLAGTAVDTNSGNKSAGTQRMVVATDQPQLTTPLNVTIQSGASGGDSVYHLVSAATTNATNIKASAGKVTGWYIYNSNAAARKLVFHNSASAPTAGASVYFSIMIPPSSGANVSFPDGIDFSAGIGITTVTGLADSDSAAVALNDLIINIFYK